MAESEAYAAYEAARAAQHAFSDEASPRRSDGGSGDHGWNGFLPEDRAELSRLSAEIRRTYQAYLDALPLRWYVVAERPDRADKEDNIWTLSRDPRRDGWSTDSGCSGYGLTFADATELADAANAAWKKRNG